MQRAIEFEALGRRWSLRYGVAALCRIEAETGMPIVQAGKLLQGGDGMKLSDVVLFFAAGLQGGDGSRAEASEVIDDLGMDQSIALLSDAFAMAFAKAKEGEAPTGKRKATAA